MRKSRNINSLVSITKAKTHPFKFVNYFKNGKIKNGIFKIKGNSINSYERSQDWPLVWEGSPACRLSKSKYFYDMIKKNKNFEKLSGKTYDINFSMGFPIDYKEALDIDEELDFTFAKYLNEAF